MIGVDPASEGLKLAADQGLVSTHEGVDWLLKQDELPDLLFEATSAYVHKEYAPRYAEAGIRAIDLTPASVGPAVIPPVNGEEHVGAPNVNMITCGGQATIPMVAAVSRVTPVSYAEIVASVSSVSAGPGTRANIDEFTRTTASGVETIGGAERGKAIIILNPAEPPMIMRDTIFCAVDPDADTDAIAASIHEMERSVQEYVPGYRLLQEPQFDGPSRRHLGDAQSLDLRRGRGRGGLPPAVLREPRHHDRRCDPGRPAHRPLDPRRELTWTDMTDFDSSGINALERTWSGTHGDEPWGKLDLRLTDTCLRDGSHHKRHQFTAQEVHDIVEALDESGIPVIEVTHGDGLGGSSFNYGFSKTPEQELIKIAAETAKRAKIAFLMLPGVGTKDDIRAAQDNGGQICRIATHCTEADVSIQHFGLARELGLETVGFLMMSHTQPPEVLAKQARIMVDAGCQCVYVVDSAGALIMEQTADRVSAVVAEIGSQADVGFHGHENLGLGVANTVIAARAGATQIDGSVRRFGAGAGNTPLEAFIGVCDKVGWTTGVDFLKIVDASEDVIKPAMPEECQLDRMTLMMGYAGVYSSFLKHAGNAAERYGVSGAQILLEAGQRKLIGGQEDQLIDIALMLKAKQDAEVGTTA